MKKNNKLIILIFLLILSMVGVQALIETAICSVISFTVSKTLLLYFKKN